MQARQRRQHGGDLSNSDGDTEDIPEPESPPEDNVPVPYTNPNQYSPGRFRGRRVLPGKASLKKRGKSLWNLFYFLDDGERLTWAANLALLTDRRGTVCPECHLSTYSLEELRSGFGSSYACGNRNCRHHEGLTERETWLWLPRAPFTRQLIALYE